jgi:hypothetical protein
MVGKSLRKAFPFATCPRLSLTWLLRENESSCDYSVRNASRTCFITSESGRSLPQKEKTAAASR